MPTKAFNPMAYAARQEKKTWTPAMQAKEDAATTLQLAVKGMKARREVNKLKQEKAQEPKVKVAKTPKVQKTWEQKVFNLKIFLKQEILDIQRFFKETIETDDMVQEEDLIPGNMFIKFAKLSLKYLDKRIKENPGKEFKLANYTTSVSTCRSYWLDDVDPDLQDKLDLKLGDTEKWFKSLKD